MITITITGWQRGHTHAYSETRRRGKRSIIPAYVMLVEGNGKEIEFRVSRDTHSGAASETPPNIESSPYRGLVREDGTRGFRIQLFEERFGNTYTIQGASPVNRTHIQIHHGPGKSEGCFLIAGGAREHERFTRVMKSLIGDQPTPHIDVFVEAR